MLSKIIVIFSLSKKFFQVSRELYLFCFSSSIWSAKWITANPHTKGKSIVAKKSYVCKQRRINLILLFSGLVFLLLLLVVCLLIFSFSREKAQCKINSHHSGAIGLPYIWWWQIVLRDFLQDQDKAVFHSSSVWSACESDFHILLFCFKKKRKTKPNKKQSKQTTNKQKAPLKT